MYREHIEHTEYISEVDQGRFNFLNGNDRGRIYRVYATGAAPRPIQRLDGKGAAELAACLSDPNRWVRETSHRLLFERQDASAVAPLEGLAADGTNPVAQVHALNVLAGMNALSDATLEAVLANRETAPEVLVHAVRLAEPRLNASAAFRGHLLRLATSAHAPLAVQVAYSLGAWEAPEAGLPLGMLLAGHAEDRYVAQAVFSALTPGILSAAAPGLLVYLQGQGASADHALAMAVRLAEAADDTETLRTLAAPLVGPDAPDRFRVAATLLDTARGPALREALLGASPKAPGLLLPVIAEARSLAQDAAAPDSGRVAALALIGREPGLEKGDLAIAQGLIDPRTPLDVARAAIAVAERLGGEAAADGLLAGWGAYTHALRGAVLDALLDQPRGMEAVLVAHGIRRHLAAPT